MWVLKSVENRQSIGLFGNGDKLGLPHANYPFRKSQETLIFVELLDNSLKLPNSLIKTECGCDKDRSPFFISFPINIPMIFKGQ